MLTGVVTYGSTPTAAYLKADGKTYFCGQRQMPYDEVGRQYLNVGEWVSFDLDYSQQRPRARNLFLLTPRTPIRAGYRETGAVVSISPKGDFCFLQRPTAHDSSLFLHIRSCQHKNFYIGQCWNYTVVRSCRHDRERWEAVNAVPVSESESIEQSNETALQVLRQQALDKIVSDLNQVLEDAGS